MKQENTFLHGKIVPPLIKFAIPLMLSLILQALYGAVDLMVVGHFGTTSSVSAVSIGGQLMQTITGIIIGLTTGVTVLIAQSVGSQDNERAGKIVASMIKLLSSIAIVLSLILVIFTPQIVSMLNTPPEAVEQTIAYIRICGAGVVFISAYNAISGIFRGVGNSKSPLLFIAIACGVNVVADLILVGYFKMDAAGAALATVLAQGVSVVFSVLYIKRGNLPFFISKEHFKDNKEIRSILKMGTPIALQDCMTSLSFLIITGIVNSMGVIASASLGISGKLFIFQAMVPLAFMSALSAFVAQNIGANQPKRAKKALFFASGFSFCCGAIMFYISHFHGDLLAKVFESNPEVIASTALFLKSASFEHFFIPLCFCFLGYFNGLGKTSFVMAQGLAAAFLFRIPLSYYFASLPNSDMYAMGIPVAISAGVSLVLSLLYFAYLQYKSSKSNIAMATCNE